MDGIKAPAEQNMALHRLPGSEAHYPLQLALLGVKHLFRNLGTTSVHLKVRESPVFRP
jgi:hypothetical protein